MFCLRHYKDGHCDQGCNNAECDWDGMDCEMKPPELVAGVMSVVVRNLDVQSLLNNKSAFLRYLGHQLRTTVRIKQSPLGNLMVYPWDASIDPASILSNGSDPTQMFNNGATGVLVYLEIDNRKCSTSNDTNCFQSAFEAADFLAAAAQRHTLESDFDIIQVRGLSNSMPSDEDANAPWIAYVLIGLLTVIMLALLFGVLVSSRRKTARGVLWFPEGFLRNVTESNHHRRSRRRGPDGQEMRHLSKIHPLEADFDSGHGMGYYDGITDVTSQYSDDSDRPPSKRMRSDGGYASDHTICTNTDYDEIDPRPWTQQHLEAADIRHPDLLALTPPEAQKCNFDVDVRGPCGLTPLMVLIKLLENFMQD
jgi:Notch-like protein